MIKKRDVQPTKSLIILIVLLFGLTSARASETILSCERGNVTVLDKGNGQGRLEIKDPTLLKGMKATGTFIGGITDGHFWIQDDQFKKYSGEVTNALGDATDTVTIEETGGQIEMQLAQDFRGFCGTDGDGYQFCYPPGHFPRMTRVLNDCH